MESGPSSGGKSAWTRTSPVKPPPPVGKSTHCQNVPSKATVWPAVHIKAGSLFAWVVAVAWPPCPGQKRNAANTARLPIIAFLISSASAFLPSAFLREGCPPRRLCPMHSDAEVRELL